VKRWLPFVVPFVLIVAVGVAAKLYFSASMPPVDPSAAVELELADVSLDTPVVTTSGMAHYPVVVKQTVPGNLFRDEQTVYLFPLFVEHDTDDRAIRVLVRTSREPERFVSYEFMKITGAVRMATPEIVPFSTEIQIGKRSDYFFTDDMVVLEPLTVEVDGEVWSAVEE